MIELVDNGQKRLKDQGSADFFAKFGQEQTRRSQLATAHYLLGLGLLGKGDQDGGGQGTRTSRGDELESSLGSLSAGHVFAAIAFLLPREVFRR